MTNLWRDDIFDNLVRLKRGHDLPNQNIVSGKFPVVASSGIKDFHNDFKASPPIVVTGRSGTLGEVQYITEKSWPLNTTLYSISFRDNLPKYVYYYLKEMHLENFNAGAGVPTLNQNHLQKLKIKIPQLDIQKKIAAILSAYDDLIENNKKRIQILENMAEELYKEWFVRFRFPNWENTEFEKGVPKGWSYTILERLGKIRTGKTPSTSNSEFYGGQYPFYKTPDMHDKVFVFETDETLTEQGLYSQKSQIIEANAIMVTCIGSGGVTAISTKKGCTNQQINSLSVANNKFLYWAYYLIKYLKPQIELYGATGATMTNLSKGKFSNLEIVKPTDALIEQYFNLVSPKFEMIKKLSQMNQMLEEQKNSLLPRLISGKLSVEDLDIQFPPSMQEQ
ncbi:restriction endonuclease subunit S [Acinetobacter portensis]|uniref:restriction endonuclease subunit S n=1 Tax=Acinetobacter portensis TaxID=1839785 RepID=UPI002003D1FB|nr:restriction endonuclease subunit S [Acinetobacter portensis]MCK7639283.1 restriction endonuclease subunit S [Acinetobacter portensis]